MRDRATQRGTRAWAGAEFMSKRLGLPNEAESVDCRAHRDLEHLDPQEMARVFLREAGITPPADPRELFQRALTTSDFPKLLADVVNKTLASMYSHAPGTFDTWTSKGFANDFKDLSIVRAAPPAELPEVGEDDEYTALLIKEGDEVARLRTHGGILGLSRQALINDDAGALQNIGRTLGITAKLTQNRLVYGQLLANPTLSDDVAVFAAARGNLLTGGTSALSRDSLALAVKTLRMMADDAGNPLSVEPKFLLVPPSLEITAHELCFSNSIPGQANAAVPNLFKKIGIIPIVEPLLESPTMTGASATAWYLFPDPTIWPVFQTLALGAADNLEPYVESRAAFNRDELQYKVRTDFACCAVGRWAVKSAGA